MDTLAVLARDAHRNAVENVEQAARFREQRDDAIRRLYEQGGISYAQIADQVGITKELVAKIIQGRTTLQRHVHLSAVSLAKALWRENCQSRSASWDRLPHDVKQHWIDNALKTQAR